MRELRAEPINKHAGFDIRSERLVPHLRQGYYRVVPVEMPGNAPKDFIRVYEYGRARKSRPEQWPQYIAKVGQKCYPSESITEHLLTRIGQTFDVKMANSKLMRAEGQIRFLSEYFLSPGERLMHGVEILDAALGDKRLVREVIDEGLEREMITFQLVFESMAQVFPDHCEDLLESFVRMVAFDALIGCHDRHHMNWGVVLSVKGDVPPQFAPIFDTARALFWNWPESRLEMAQANGWHRDSPLQRYVMKSTPVLGWGDMGKSATHFDVVRLLAREYAEFAPALAGLSSPQALADIALMMENEFGAFLTELRHTTIVECLEARFELYQRSLEGEEV